MAFFYSLRCPEVSSVQVWNFKFKSFQYSIHANVYPIMESNLKHGYISYWHLLQPIIEFGSDSQKVGIAGFFNLAQKKTDFAIL